MSEEELKKKIANKIFRNQVGLETNEYWFGPPIPVHTLEYCKDMTEDIFTDIRDAGYEPPESVREMVEKSYADGIDDAEQKYKGYMSLDDMKGLFLEAQAKKCSQCPKNQEGK